MDRLLLVEDEVSLLELLKENLEEEGYKVAGVSNGKDAVKRFKEEHFDLIILDIMLPGMDGLNVCENIRLINNEIPIIFLSAKNTPEDRIRGLKKGGDDYLTKPFHLEELLLRITKLVSRNKSKSDNPNVLSDYQFGENSINFESYEAQGKNGKFNLTKKEAHLLKLLIENRGEVVSREKILQSVWGYSVYPSTRTIDNFILAFRKYFEEDPKNPSFFTSVRGVGYKFTDSVVAVA